MSSHDAVQQRPAGAERFQSIVERFLDVVLVVDAHDGRIHYVNAAARTALGHEPRDLVGAPFSGLFPPETVSMLLERLRAHDAVLADQSFRRADDTVTRMDLTAAMAPWGDRQAFVVTLRSTEERRRAEAEQASLVARLQEALARVKLLSGLLPICCHCKRIRDAQGSWTDVEDYLRRHSEADFTHGICSECLGAHHPGCE